MNARRLNLNLSNPVHLLAIGFGSGLAPKAPGTFGTLVAVPIYLLIAELPLVAYAGVVITAALVGIWLCGRTAEDLGVHDHPAIVWDEIVGYLLAMIGAPPGWLWPVLGFLLFRCFDIWKPWPISFVDRKVHGGIGIMIDDLLAGGLALLVLQLVAVLTGTQPW
jgi:phosphatidylglycerophosphatase A